jgi:phosphoserine phosphatase
MDMVATLVAQSGLGQGVVSAAADALRDAGLAVGAPAWIEPGEAVDLPFGGDEAAARAALECLDAPFDRIVQRSADRHRMLLVADMDSTMITIECIDELADYAGIKDEIAAVTEQAMRGELDFESALRSRVALLKGLPVATIQRCLEERVRIMPGAVALVRTLRARGGKALLVSGGFTDFAVPVAERIGFDAAIANRLGQAGDVLDGTVGDPIVGAATKRSLLGEWTERHGIDPARTLAIGDGANDIPMIEAAGLGIAYHAKPRTRAAAAAAIDYGDLSVALFAMGLRRADWSVA